MSLLEKVDTKLQAYKLVHDPSRLLSLLYSKYGDIEEDLNYLYINQILYNRPSHYNSIFKEYQYTNYIDEFLKRFYSLKESASKIPKLNDYYKNYHLFFCRPVFRNWKISEMMHNYGDNKAEIFYKNNYATSNEEEEEKESSSDSSLSSLDNVTDNKTIFDKKTRLLIDHNNSNKGTLTLDSSRTLKSNLNLLTKRSKDDSFIKFIAPLVNYQSSLKKKNNKTHNKTSSNNNKKNKINQRNKFINKDLKKNNGSCKKMKNTIYNFVKNDFNYEIKNNQKKIFLSPKLKPYLSNYKSNLEEFKKNKNKMVSNGIEKTKNKTYNSNSSNYNNNNNINNNNNNNESNNNRNDSNINSNFRNFSKLSITLNINNLNNNINFSNTMRNSNIISTNMKNSNGSNSKSKNNRKKIPNGSNNQISCNASCGNTIQKSKNITYDIKNVNSMNNLKKFHSNSNFSAFNHQQNNMRNKKKSNYGSNFNLVKNPLSAIQSNLNGAPNSNNKISHLSKNKTYHQSSHKISNINNNNYNPSSSVPKYSFNKNEKEKKKKESNKNNKEKKQNNNLHKRKNNGSYTNTINLNNLIFSSHRTTSNNKNNNNIISPKNTIQSNRIMMNLNNKYNNSRNKKQIMTHTQTNIKSFRKEQMTQKTKSIDDQKIKLKNILFGINRKDHNYNMSQRLVSQIEELIKKSKIPYIKHHNGNSNIIFYNGNDKGSKKSIVENSNTSTHNTHSGSNISCRNSSKPINVNLNSRINSEDRKDKIIRVISNKK